MRKQTIVSLVLLSALGLAACSKNSEDAGAASKSGSGDAAKGKQVWESTCATCHAADGTGVKGLGKALTDSEFVKKSSDADVVKMVIEGRAVDDPLNTTKIAMPARGGNAGLSDADVADAVAYLRTLAK